MSISMETFSACIRYWFTIIRCVARACCEGGPKTPEKSMWLSLQQYGRGQLHTPARFEQRFLALGSVGHAETVYDKKKEKEHSNLLRMRYSSIEVGNSLVFLAPERARADHCPSLMNCETGGPRRQLRFIIWRTLLPSWRGKFIDPIQIECQGGKTGGKTLKQIRYATLHCDWFIVNGIVVWKDVTFNVYLL